MTTMKAIRLASLVTAINVLVASGFSIAAIIRPQYLVPVESAPTEASLLLAMYAAAPRIPLALFALGAIYKQATPALLILGALAGAMQLLDAGIGLFEHDLGKCAGPLFLAVLQFFVVYLLNRSSASRRKPSADKRTLRPALPSSPSCALKLMQHLTRLSSAMPGRVERVPFQNRWCAFMAPLTWVPPPFCNHECEGGVMGCTRNCEAVDNSELLHAVVIFPFCDSDH